MSRQEERLRKIQRGQLAQQISSQISEHILSLQDQITDIATNRLKGGTLSTNDAFSYWGGVLWLGELMNQLETQIQQGIMAADEEVNRGTSNEED